MVRELVAVRALELSRVDVAEVVVRPAAVVAVGRVRVAYARQAEHPIDDRGGRDVDIALEPNHRGGRGEREPQRATKGEGGRRGWTGLERGGRAYLCAPSEGLFLVGNAPVRVSARPPTRPSFSNMHTSVGSYREELIATKAPSNPPHPAPTIARLHGAPTPLLVLGAKEPRGYGSGAE